MNNNRCKCIITGVNGFCGKKIFEFHKKKLHIIGISRNKKNQNIIKQNIENSILNISQKIKKNYFDYIIHTAAYHKLNSFKFKPKSKAKKNQDMVKNLVSLCKKKNIKNFIFFSTIDISYEIMGDKKNFYNLSKLNSENYLKKQFKKGVFDRLIILRLPAIIGKDCHESFISNLISSLKNDSPVKIFDKDKHYNNLIHIEDLNNLISKLISKNFSGIKTINCLATKPMKLINVYNYLKNKIKSRSFLQIEQNKNKKYKKIKTDSFFKFMSVKKSINLHITDTLK